MEVLTQMVWDGKYWGGCNLIRKFLDDSMPKEILDKFFKLRQVEQRIQLIDNLLHNTMNGTNSKLSMLKSKEMSKELRNKGNALYRHKKFPEALRAYSLSLCFSPDRSAEFYFAIANRSAVYFEVGKFENCKRDLELVFSTHSDAEEIQKLKERLKSRLEKCDAEIARSCHNDCEDKNGSPPASLYWFQLTTRNERVPSAESFVDIRSSVERGRHVVATKDIPPGTTVIVEDPFAKVLLRECLWDVDHCHTCLKNVQNGISCSSCVFAIFCSAECRENHDRYMCEISSMLHTIRPSRILLLSTKIITHQGPEKLYELFLRQPLAEEEPRGFEQGEYSSQSYVPILNLIYHDQPSSDLLRYTVEACVVVNLLWRFSSFFENHQDYDFKVFICKLLTLHLRNLPPNAHSLNELVGYDMVEYGAGAYALLSLVNHSCDPNVTRFNLPDGRVAVVTIKNVPCNTELLDNYGVHYAVTELTERRKLLRENYYFDCNCPACISNWPSFTELKKLPPSAAECKNPDENDKICIKFDKAFERVMNGEDINTNELMECLTFFETNFKLPYAKINEVQETFKHYVNACIRKYHRNL